MSEIITRVEDQGLKIIGATIIPRHNEVRIGIFGPRTREMTEVRHEVNAWIRHHAEFDAVLDFDALVRDPNKPDHINPLYDVGDHIHPNDTGYSVMGNSIDLMIFQKTSERGPSYSEYLEQKAAPSR